MGWKRHCSLVLLLNSTTVTAAALVTAGETQLIVTIVYLTATARQIPGTGSAMGHCAVFVRVKNTAAFQMGARRTYAEKEGSNMRLPGFDAILTLGSGSGGYVSRTEGHAASAGVEPSLRITPFGGLGYDCTSSDTLCFCTAGTDCDNCRAYGDCTGKCQCDAYGNCSCLRK
jgi:hypothetical protein